MEHRLEFHTSSNGDCWLLGRDDALEGIVIHQANMPSGGNVSRTGIADFLARSTDAPERRALLRLIGSLVGDAPASRGEAKSPASDGRQAPDDDLFLEPISRAG